MHDERGVVLRVVPVVLQGEPVRFDVRLSVDGTAYTSELATLERLPGALSDAAIRAGLVLAHAARDAAAGSVRAAGEAISLRLEDLIRLLRG